MQTIKIMSKTHLSIRNNQSSHFSYKSSKLIHRVRKQFAIFQPAKRELFNWRVWGGHSPCKTWETWTISTLGYCHSGDWKKQILKSVIVKTNDKNKLLLLYFKIWRRVESGRLRVLFVSLIIYSTVLNCRRWNYMRGWRFFLHSLQQGGQNKMILRNFGNLTLKWGVVN